VEFAFRPSELIVDWMADTAREASAVAIRAVTAASR